MVTNASGADLIYKDPDGLEAVTTHKNDDKNKGLKASIKPFKIDQNQLTGLRNFTEISKDPLALPAYALPESGASQAATQS